MKTQNPSIRAAILRAYNATTYLGEYGDHDTDGSLTEQGRVNNHHFAIRRHKAVKAAREAVFTGRNVDTAIAAALLEV